MDSYDQGFLDGLDKGNERIRALEAKIEDLRAVADTKGVRSEEMADAVYRLLAPSGGTVE